MKMTLGRGARENFRTAFMQSLGLRHVSATARLPQDTSLKGCIFSRRSTNTIIVVPVFEKTVK